MQKLTWQQVNAWRLTQHHFLGSAVQLKIECDEQ